MRSKTCILFIAITITEFCIAQFNDTVPGVVIDHRVKSTEIYIGSPSICILPNGDYVASHDEFGPKSAMEQSPKTKVFKSTDKGEHWELISIIDGQFWSNLFVHNRVLYIMGTNKLHGDVVIRKTYDGGITWTIPTDSTNGLLMKGEYHTAPVPVIINKGRIWRAVENAKADTDKWGERYSVMMLSVPENSDLLNAKNWTSSNHLPYNKSYLNGNFDAWLEGNAIVAKSGKIVNVLRVHTSKLTDEYCAIVDVNGDGKKIRFNSRNFFKMPGATKKFTIRYDEKSGLYWSIVNDAPKQYSDVKNERIRNCMALISSPDLKSWKIEKIILQHPDVYKHGFQYADWQFDGDDIVFVSRTAFDDEEGGASNNHDANFFTFHRIKNYFLK